MERDHREGQPIERTGYDELQHSSTTQNANCYTYKQIIKIIDTQDPIVECPASPVTICDLTSNDPQLWNAMYWWDNANQSHDLCEAPSDICLTATDACSGSNISFEYQLFLDLDGDGTMETVVNSTQLGNQVGGLGWNNILYGNVTGAGQPRQFDDRNVPTNQKWGFAIQETVTGHQQDRMCEIQHLPGSEHVRNATIATRYPQDQVVRDGRLRQRDDLRVHDHHQGLQSAHRGMLQRLEREHHADRYDPNVGHRLPAIL